MSTTTLKVNGLEAVVLRVQFVEERVDFGLVHAIDGIVRASGLAGVGSRTHHGLPLGLGDFEPADFEAPGQTHFIRSGSRS
jgi:hypothetical protein